jgi:hypothetical protein
MLQMVPLVFVRRSTHVECSREQARSLCPEISRNRPDLVTEIRLPSGVAMVSDEI